MTISFEARRSSIVVHVSGEIDMSTAPSLSAELERAVGGDGATPQVVVELGHVRFLDARGLAALVKGSQTARRAGRQLVLSNPSPMIRRLLAITGLETQLPVDEEAEQG